MLSNKLEVNRPDQLPLIPRPPIQEENFFPSTSAPFPYSTQHRSTDPVKLIAQTAVTYHDFHIQTVLEIQIADLRDRRGRKILRQPVSAYKHKPHSHARSSIPSFICISYSYSFGIRPLNFDCRDVSLENQNS